MVPELNPDLINNFRGKVHDHDDFIRLYFADYKTKNSIEGKDIWSKICACMDLLLSDLKSIIPAYQKAIQEVEWYEDDVFELFNMRSQIHLDNHYDFSKVLEYAGGSSNSSSGETSL
ncbi:hypothetical protein [Bacillus sp. REN16]|uniref:hypothetical protein n=1 Tax=Bacillus sp. REN16 TaxID=2887296 RepID=UPI001E2ADE45|nr:hypothetical protein [Bacillus sp. REN16]MCC3358197.1 hypothetical protein [Bacillus sp. REN16]